MEDHTKRYRIGKDRSVLVTRRTFLKGVGGISAILASGVAPALIREAGPSALRKVKFTLPWMFVGGHAFEFAAQKMYWKNRGLDVELFRGRGSGAATKQVGTGEFDFGEASYTVMLAEVAKGLDVVAIGAKLQKSPIGISCRKDANVKVPKDMEGKRLVQAVGSGDTVLYPAFAAAAGFDPKKVNTYLAAPDKLIPIVLGGQSECMGVYWVSNGATFAIKSPGPTEFLYGDYGIQGLDLGLIANRKIIKSDPKLTQDIVDGAMEGLKYQLLEPEKALDIMAEAKPEVKTIERKELITHLGNTNFLAFGPAVEAHGLGWMDPKDQAVTREIIMKYMDIKELPPSEKLFTNQFAGKIKLAPEEWKKAKTWANQFAPKKQV
jgi:NitT/TauT family transport system substrate-binding protein